MDIDFGAVARAWTTDGFVILPGFLSAEDLADGVAELPLLFPTAAEYHDDADPARNARLADEFGGIDNFPFASTSLNLLAAHRRLIALAEHLLGQEDLRLFSIEAWAKYTGAADYEQIHHRDYLAQSLLAPTSDPLFGQVEMFVYLVDVPADLGPTAYVPLRHTSDLPAMPNWYPRTVTLPDEEHPAWNSAGAWPHLYAHEQLAPGPAGTVIAYTNRTFHRGTQLTRPRGARYTLHINFRPVGNDWQVKHSWLRAANTWQWHDFVNRADPKQLALFGWPPPGHPYWTSETLAGVHARYPSRDLTPWTP